MPLADLLVWLANRQVAGTLLVERDSVRKLFAVEQGMVVRSASNDPREHLGQFLIHFGLLTDEQLHRAFETQAETQVLLGRILVMIGVVPEEHVIQTLRVKVSETLLDAFYWPTGRFVFEDTPAVERRPEVHVAVPLLDLHAEGVYRAERWQRLAELFPDRRMLLEINEARLRALPPLGAMESRIVTLARLGLSIEAIALELHATDYQLAARLLEMHDQGLLRAYEPSPTSRPPISGRRDGGPAAQYPYREAMARGDFSTALRYAQEGSYRPPDSVDLGPQRAELEALARQAGLGPSREAVPVLTGLLTPAMTRQMTAKQRYVLARIDGKRSVGAIIQVSPMHDLEALEVMRQFERDQIIRLITP